MRPSTFWLRPAPPPGARFFSAPRPLRPRAPANPESRRAARGGPRDQSEPLPHIRGPTAVTVVTDLTAMVTVPPVPTVRAPSTPALWLGSSPWHTDAVGAGRGGRRRAQHAPSPALSHEQADTCVVAVKVECTVAYAAGHRLRTRPGSRVFCVCADASVAAWAASHVHVNALTATQEQTRAARVLARNVSRTCGHTRRRSQGRMPCVGVEAGVAVEATRFTRTD